MKHLLFVFLTAIFFCTGTLAAQSRTSYIPASIRQDTVFKYDTVFVTDTVRVRYKQPEMEQLLTNLLLSEQEGTSQKYLIISATGTATISPIRIIDSVNISPFKQTDCMKKIGFFGVVLFAFQHMVLAQNNISINVGGGGHFNRVNTLLRSRTGGEFLTGIGYKRDFVAGKLSLNTDLNYHFMLRSDFESAALLNCATPNPVYINEDQQTPNHMFSMPVALYWNTKWFSPGIGGELYYKQSSRISQVLNDVNGVPQTSQYRVPSHGVGVFAGVQIPVSSRLRARVLYYRGVTSEYAWQIGGGGYYSKMQRLEMVMSYRLR